MTGRLQDKVALITGASSGIGAETAKRFAAEGARIVVADIQEQAGRALAEALPGEALFCTCDVTREEHVAAAVDFAVAQCGRLDIMVNNAGVVGAVGSIAETSLDAYEKTMAVLSRGVFLGMKHAARVMIPQKSGVILSLSSVAGVNGGLGPHIYTGAKFGVVGLTRSVASELSAHGIRVNAIAPGSIATAMTADVTSGDPTDLKTVTDAIEQSSPLGIAGLPIDIANGLLYLASDEARYVTGHTLVVDAGVTTGAGASRLTQRDAGYMGEAGKRD